MFAQTWGTVHTNECGVRTLLLVLMLLPKPRARRTMLADLIEVIAILNSRELKSGCPRLAPHRTGRPIARVSGMIGGF